MISSETEMKMKLRCNVCNNIIVKKKCSSITVLSLTLFWAVNFLQINYIAKTVFCDVNDAVTVIKQAFLIKFVNNDLSTAWRSEDKM